MCGPRSHPCKWRLRTQTVALDVLLSPPGRTASALGEGTAGGGAEMSTHGALKDN